MKEFALIAPTASGKTQLAITLAKELNGAILSLDSLCVYRQINIASAKPTAAEQAQVRHFGVDVASVEEHFCAADFIRCYREAKAWCEEAGKTLIITGGSGFYLNAILTPLAPKVPPLAPFSQALSREQLWEKVEQTDPEFAQKFSKNDSFRLQKWFEIHAFTNQPPSVWLRQNSAPPVAQKMRIFNILWQKEALNRRIAQRTRQMFEAGLLDEARALFAEFDAACKPLCSIGLKECGEFLRGEINSLDALENLITTHTTQLAKRQRTFNKKAFSEAVTLEVDEENFDELPQRVVALLRA